MRAHTNTPAADRHTFERAIAAVQDPRTPSNEVTAALRDYREYVRRLVRRKRDEPGDDLLSDLVSNSDLTDGEIVGITQLLFRTGHETVESMIALAVFALPHDRRRWEALAGSPAMIPNAVEELLRYITLVQVGAFTRTAVEDVDIDGTLIGKGESVIVSLAAANRDPARFSDPDVLDLSRKGSDVRR